MELIDKDAVRKAKETARNTFNSMPVEVRKKLANGYERLSEVELLLIDILPRLKSVGFLCGVSKYMVFGATSFDGCLQPVSERFTTPSATDNALPVSDFVRLMPAHQC